MAELNSRFLHFNCDPERGWFEVQAVNEERPFVRQARLSLAYNQGKGRFLSLRDSWQTFEPAGYGEKHNTPAGQERGFEIACGVDRQGVDARLEFYLSQSVPLLLWRVTLRNQSTRPLVVKAITMLEAGARFANTEMALGQPGQAGLAFYSHGWQSWSYSAVYGRGQPARRSRLGWLESGKIANPSTPQLSTPGHYASDFFGIIGDRTSRSGWLAGYLSQQQQFGSLEAWLEDQPSLRMWANGDDALLDPGDEMATDWAALQYVRLDDPEPLEAYARAVAGFHDVRIPEQVPAGWCSWYDYYTNVTAADVRSNLAAIQTMRDELPLSLVQIDDGFEAQIGDWLEFKPSFPQGVEPLAAEIRAAGLTPGLWLAPFIVHPASRLAREHPDWLLKGRFGGYARAGYNWGAIQRGLDLTHPGALEYVRQVIDTAVHAWGYPYLKLDFLYAGGLRGQYRDPHLTRAQVLRRGLEAIREAAGPETFLLGCGVPIGTAVGLFEAMRVGADVGGSWKPKWFGTSFFFEKEPHIPSMRMAIQNPLTRNFMHQRWWLNDPDCLLVRPETELTLDEVRSLAGLIALSGGMLLLSDNLVKLPEDRLRIAKIITPVIGQRPRVLDWFERETPEKLRLDLDGATGAWHLLGLFNWADSPVDFSLRAAEFGLQEGAYWLSSFWDGKIQRLLPEQVIVFRRVPAHGSLMLAARPATSGAQYLGSDLHVSQGQEVKGWQASGNEVEIRFALPRTAKGWVRLYLPGQPRSAVLDGAQVSPKAEGDGVYAFPVRFNREGCLRVEIGV